MRSSTVFLICALTVLTLAQPNYQERAIFLSEDDNPCYYGRGTLDKINYIINVPGKETIKQTVTATTMCEKECRIPSKAIWPSDGMHLSDPGKGHLVYFAQETRYISYRGILYKIINKMTLGGDVKLFGRTDYQCHIVGDGNIQHWGVQLKDFQPAITTV